MNGHPDIRWEMDSLFEWTRFRRLDPDLCNRIGSLGGVPCRILFFKASIHETAERSEQAVGPRGGSAGPRSGRAEERKGFGGTGGGFGSSSSHNSMIFRTNEDMSLKTWIYSSVELYIFFVVTVAGIIPVGTILTFVAGHGHSS